MTSVDTFASDAIGRRFQTALARTLVTARCVGAFAAVADARILLALVDIVATPSVHEQHVTRTEGIQEERFRFKIGIAFKQKYGVPNPYLQAHEKLPGVFIQLSSHPPLFTVHSSTSKRFEYLCV